MGEFQQTARAVGWLWVALAVFGFIVAAFFVCSDFREPEVEDPAGFGVVFGAISALVSLPILFCGVALVKAWRGKVLWFLLPVGLLAWGVRGYFFL